MAKSRERGFALLVALWLIAALAVLASVYARYVDNVATAARRHEDDFQIETAERSAIDMTAGKLIAAPTSSRGALSFSVGDADVEVEFVSEAARIDLNGAPAAVLAKFFVQLGAAPRPRGPTLKTSSRGARAPKATKRRTLTKQRAFPMRRATRRSKIRSNSPWCAACRPISFTARFPLSPCSAGLWGSMCARPRRPC